MTSETSAQPARSLLQQAALLQRQNRMNEAAAVLSEARARFPQDTDVRFAIGNFLFARGQAKAAAAQFRQTLALEPGYAQAHHNLGIVLKRLGQLACAAASLTRALRVDPTLAGCQAALGDALIALGNREAALPALRQAALLKPDDARSWMMLGYLAKGRDELNRAVGGFGRAVALAPSNITARLGLCMSRLPTLYDRPEEIAEARRRYRADLEALAASVRFDEPQSVAAAAEAIGSFQPYYLAYQEQCDRDLQEIYGRFVARVMAARHPRWADRPPMPPVTPGEPLRVGIASGFFRWHTIWKLMIRGWMEGLDPSRIQLYGYHTAGARDACTDRAQARFHRFTAGLPFERMCEAIRADDLHVLIYPEIGMDPMAAKLAALRLAPVQCVSWGHPDTTGLPTVDCFLGSDLMEPEGAEAHYTERLVRLPGLGIAYAPLEVAAEPADFAAFGVRPDATAYLCCQYVSKYLPQHDDVFARIAASVPDSQFLFINPRSDALTARLHRRLGEAFARRGLDAGRHVVILPYLSPGQYAALNRRADVYLDSIGWSGGNTTLEAVAEGLPVVTLPGALMRGRHSAAILNRIGVTETIAGDLDAYVAMAVRLGTDMGWRRSVSARVSAGCGLIHTDDRPLRALETFLERCAAGPD
ncbi:tetratricopeptide repeat protein [Azospirillum sp. SYSU D00513]|uniref:O-linked N-acetylglucosamine transferase, SPINDLY family protein n=1 Tax=Azospirillum sp. SYSU D00513 TaxID=2812561 RepID=UPI001A97BF96|nr:tetratricopeptide repeat protein [Azospirillum sp. SYSU D00513]